VETVLTVQSYNEPMLNHHVMVIKCGIIWNPWPCGDTFCSTWGKQEKWNIL